MKKLLKNLFLLPALITGLGSVPAGRATAQVFTTLHSFAGDSASDGANPQAGLILSGNTLYGTAYKGGGSGNGTVFKVNADATGFTNLHYFGSDGAFLYSGLVLSGSTLYGTTSQGGGGYGNVFKVNTNGTGFTNLYSFHPQSFTAPYSNSDGALPEGTLILSGSNLYGTALGGGPSGNGTVFKVNTNGTLFTNLHTFTGGAGGAHPSAGLILSGNTLYGTTEENFLGDSGYGTVFKINTDGTGFTNLHTFGGYSSDGGYPKAGMILSGSTLYGTADYGIFAVYTNGTGFTNIVSIGGAAGLTLSGDTLYGAMEGGGSSGNGAVFAVSTNGTGFTFLHSFTEALYGTNIDGAVPLAGLILSGSTLYGTASQGGSLGKGTVFSLAVGSCDPPPAGLVGWWRLEGSALDSAGPHNGALSGGVSNAPGMVGQAFRFNGTDASVQISSPPSPQQLSVEAWVKFDSLDSVTTSGGQQYLVFRQNSRIYNFEGFALLKERDAGGDRLHFVVTSVNPSVINDDIASTNYLVTNVFYHVVATFDGTTMNLYVNGALQASAYHPYPIDYGSAPMFFGNSGTNVWYGYLAGTLDEVSLYNRALSAQEVNAIYLSGSYGKCPLAISSSWMANLFVPGTSDPWLAGMPNGSVSGWDQAYDTAPAQSPVQASNLVITAGSVLAFSASGAEANGAGVLFGPVGNVANNTSRYPGAENGMADIYVPMDALLGVFLDNNVPSSFPAPALLDFSSAAARNFSSLKPALRQPFFIGDGLTSQGITQQFFAPQGSTRLFLGPMDAYRWADNVGGFMVTVTVLPQLTISRSGANVVLKWPTNYAGFTLQATTNLVSPVAWNTVSPGPVVVNGQSAVTNAIVGTGKFYRLSQ